jgi:thiamine pyrophosphate-dependent acetolactate synthase large subunit-like protein
MHRFSESTNELTGAVMAAVGIAAIYGGIGVCLLGEMDGLNVSVAGCITASAAAVPLSAAAKQRDDRYQDLCAQLRTRRG